jgi:NADPH:quinone reductase-like Zn-dependent oxidoreductase
MWAIEIDRFGPPSVMVKRSVEEPQPASNQIVVEVMSSGVNPKDTYIRKGRLALMSGRKFPIRMGYDLSGVVHQCNSKQTRFKPGDRVFGSISAWAGGAYAEFAAIAVNELAILPDSLSFEQGASLPIAALTAYQALTKLAQIKSGDQILINGASGGVGVFAIQLAKYFAANVTTLSSATNFDFCRSLGSDLSLDYNATALKSIDKTFDIIFDAFGNLSFAAVKDRLTANGIYITTVPCLQILKNTVFTPIGKRARLVIVRSNTADLQTLASLVIEGVVKTIIDKTFSFDEVVAAHRYSETHRARGKIVLTR